MDRYYTGIGSRITPIHIIDKMKNWAMMLATNEYVLRSGGADGADTAFEQGCLQSKNSQKEIFLPWKGFNKNSSPHYDIPKEAFILAEKFHPGWSRLSDGAKRLMARNIQQVCGKNLDSPSAFVICYTSDGCESHKTRTRKTGGTGQAISLAWTLDIPVFNLQQADAEDRLIKFLNEISI
jgi:hypothetical protein